MTNCLDKRNAADTPDRATSEPNRRVGFFLSTAIAGASLAGLLAILTVEERGTILMVAASAFAVGLVTNATSAMGCHQDSDLPRGRSIEKRFEILQLFGSIATYFGIGLVCADLGAAAAWAYFGASVVAGLVFISQEKR